MNNFIHKIKISILLLILIIGFNSIARADKIKDLEIEGISIGDNLLDFISEEEIIKESSSSKLYDYLKEPKKFTIVEFVYHPKLVTYESIQVIYKNISGDYIVYAIIGKIYFKDNIEDCYTLRDKIIKEIELDLDINFDESKTILHPSDKNKKSKVNQSAFWLNNNDVIIAECYDWSEEMKYYDNLKINMFSNEDNLWITNYR